MNTKFFKKLLTYAQKYLILYNEHMTINRKEGYKCHVVMELDQEALDQ